MRSAIAAGALNYVLKPFPPGVLVERLHAFARFWRALGADAHLDQTGIDRALQVLRTADTPVATARKGRSPVTAEAVVEVLRRASDAVTAAEVAEQTGVSRATAQRYLSDLARDGRVRLTLRYGTTGPARALLRVAGPQGLTRAAWSGPAVSLPPVWGAWKVAQAPLARPAGPGRPRSRGSPARCARPA